MSLTSRSSESNGEKHNKYLQSYLKSFVQTQTVNSDSKLFNPPPPQAARPACSMGRDNLTWVSEFVLLDLSGDRQTQAGLFVLFGAAYLLTLLGNGLILVLIRLDP